jgi:hypothetical protein
MSDKLTVASEVDAYCTKCKMDLTHRIIAMVGYTIKKVECLTCHGHHTFRAPKSMPRPAAGSAVRKRGELGKPSPRPTGAKAAQATRTSEHQVWERAIVGRKPEEFTTYAMGQSFSEGQLVRHSRFGDGVVTEIRDPNKVSILFETGVRTLAHGRS